VVATPSLALSLLPPALAAWRQAFPHTQCELATQHTDAIVDILRIGEADLALSLRDPRHPNVVAEPVAEGTLVALARIGTWPEAQRGLPLPLQSLAEPQAGLIGLQTQDPLGELIAAAFDAADCTPVCRTVVQTYQLARGLVEQGGGVTLVDPFTARWPRPEGLETRPVEPALPVRLYALSASQSPLSHGARELVKQVAAQAQACLKSEAKA